ncbi:MAG: TorF family putative porin [Rubrivivax sp.]|nr:TorF family putative porin [Rubrivivax sp.]
MKLTVPILSTAALLAAAPLAAQAADSPFSANVALTSKYKFRGQDQSDAAKAVLPAIQGGFDFSSGGFYLGNWNSSVGFLGGTEMDFYGGYRGEVEGFSYDVGALYYYYPGTDSSGNTTELYASVGFGPVTAKYSRVISSKWFGVDGGKGTGYLELNAGYEVAKGVKLVAHLGATQFSGGAKNNGAVNFSDYKLGADFDVGSGFTVGAAYVGATKKGDWGDINKSRVVLTLSKAL